MKPLIVILVVFNAVIGTTGKTTIEIFHPVIYKYF